MGYFIYAILDQVGELALGNLPFLPWWGWLIALALIYVALIVWVPLPWWAWVLLVLVTVVYLFFSLLVGFVPGPQG